MYIKIVTIPQQKSSRVSATIRRKRPARQKKVFEEGRRRIKKRLANNPGPERLVPMVTATKIHYEETRHVRGLSAGQH